MDTKRIKMNDAQWVRVEAYREWKESDRVSVEEAVMVMTGRVPYDGPVGTRVSLTLRSGRNLTQSAANEVIDRRVADGLVEVQWKWIGRKQNRHKMPLLKWTTKSWPVREFA